MTLVDYVTEIGQSFSKVPFDHSMARRFIIEGRVRINGEIIEDPSFRLTDDQKGRVVEVDRTGWPRVYTEQA